MTESKLLAGYWKYLRDHYEANSKGDVDTKKEYLSSGFMERDLLILDLHERLEELEHGDPFIEGQYRGQKQLREDLQARVDEFVVWLNGMAPAHIHIGDVRAKLRELGLVKED
jgi:hypothetical protein